MSNPPATPTDDPGRLCPEHGYLVVAAVALTLALVAYAADATLPIELNRGAYAILVALFVAGSVGWLVRSEGRKVRRASSIREAELADLAENLTALTSVVAELSEQVAQSRVTYLPAPRRSDEGQRYVGSMAVGQGPVPQQRIGLDADTIAAARSLARQLIDGPAEQTRES